MSLEGLRFGRLVANHKCSESGPSRWACTCDCGASVEVLAHSLKRGATKSCGCLKADKAKTGDSRRRHGLRHSPTYKSWQKMKERCHNPKSNRYHCYGGRGIKVCHRWMKFDNFLADMGLRPDGKTIGRLDNDKDYCPENCHWATEEEQSNNKSTSRFIELEGRVQTLTQWAKEAGLPRGTLTARLNRGWDLSRAITTPIKKS